MLDLARMKPNPKYPRRWCQHCGVRVRSSPRRLCWVCYHNDDIRKLYPYVDVEAERLKKRLQKNKCEMCGTYAQTHCRRCTTCRLPDGKRELMHATLTEFERRAELEIPLFDGPRPSGMVY